MTNDAWEEIVPDLCMAIRKSKVVSEHPDWWVFLCCDGFKSHLLETCLPIFTNHKIYLVKEEGDTSHLCQAYDQMVAKADKLHFRSLLDTVRWRMKTALTQWDMIVICCHALKNVPANAWVQSFKKVNLHPKSRKPFSDWRKQIDNFVEAGDRFFTNNNQTLFHAMPACWKHLLPDERREVCRLMDKFTKDAKQKEAAGTVDCCNPWTKENLLQLASIVSMDDIPK